MPVLPSQTIWSRNRKVDSNAFFDCTNKKSKLKNHYNITKGRNHIPVRSKPYLSKQNKRKRSSTSSWTNQTMKIIHKLEPSRQLIKCSRM